MPGTGDDESLTQTWIQWLGGKVAEMFQEGVRWCWGWVQAGMMWVGQVLTSMFEGLKALCWYGSMALIATCGQVAAFILDGLLQTLPTGSFVTRTIDDNPILAALNWLLPISEVLTWLQIVGGALILWLCFSWILRWLKVMR